MTDAARKAATREAWLAAENAQLEVRNGELQAQNAELHTHDAELQAQNEELHTHHRELLTQIVELHTRLQQQEGENWELARLGGRPEGPMVQWNKGQQ